MGVSVGVALALSAIPYHLIHSLHPRGLAWLNGPLGELPS